MLKTLKSHVKRAIGWQPDRAIVAPTVDYPTVQLTFWSPHGAINFGDFLSRVIVELALAERGMTLGDEAKADRQMLAIGSVMHFARTDAVIWGTGVNGKIDAAANTAERLDVRAVRGPLTREFLMKRGIPVPEIYGDPALLLKRLSRGRFKPTGSARTIFVPNLNDMSHIADIDLAGLPVVSPKRSWNRCISDILDASFVVSSSLHGVIIAETFGIPARYVRLTDSEHTFKYEDYYLGSGRAGFAPARSIGHALELGGEPLPNFDPEPLLAAFPYDLWDLK